MIQKTKSSIVRAILFQKDDLYFMDKSSRFLYYYVPNVDEKDKNGQLNNKKT